MTLGRSLLGGVGGQNSAVTTDLSLSSRCTSAQLPDFNVVVVAVLCCRTLLPYFVAIRCCRTLLPYVVAVLCSAWYGTVRPNFDPT